MAYRRFDISIAIPLDKDDKVPQAVSDVWESMIRPGLLKLKEYAEDIPTDHGVEEWTTRATMYTCGHPTDPCTDQVTITNDTDINMVQAEVAEL